MQFLGIHFDPPFYRTALVENKGEIKILECHTDQLPKKNHKIITGLSAKDFILKVLNLKVPNKRYIEKAIAFQAETASFLPATETMSEILLLEETKEEREALLFIASKELIAAHLDQMRTLNIDPDFVSCLPLALCAFMQWKMGKEFDGLAIYVGTAEWTCICMERGKLKKAHAIGSNHLIELNKFLTRFEKMPLFFTGQPHLIPKKMGTIVPDSIFAIAIGLALCQPQIQFRKQEFFPQKNLKKLGRNTVALFSFSLFLSLSLLFSGNFVHSLQKKRFGKENIEEWIAKIETSDNEEPFICKAPKVAEILAWLSQHPLLLQLQKEGDPLRIIDLHYDLVSFPKIGSIHERYKAKVEIQFELNSPLHARQFHEALRKGDSMIDPKGEVKWEVLHDSYRVSFYLKNKERSYV